MLPARDRALKKGALGVLFLTVFVDLLGFGIVLPMLPRYAEDYGASGGEIGFLLASFSAMQFLFAPVWGRLSDKYGRRPLLMLGLFGSIGSYALFAVADTYALLLASRILAGVFGATIGAAQAYIADVTGRHDRGKEMALIGAAFGVGFTLGPAIGGLGYAWGGPSAPGWIAAGFSAVAFLVAWKKLPEPERHVEARTRSLLDVSALRAAMRTPIVLGVIGLSFLATFCFANFEGTLALLSDHRWGYDITENGFLFTYVGFCLLIAQGFLVRRFLPRAGEKNFVIGGSLLLALGLLGIALGGGLWILPVAVVGFSMLSPSLSSLLSLASPDDRQGEMLGLGQSALSLARILGPWIGNVLFFAVTPEAPYWLAAGLMGIAFLSAFGLRSRAAISR